MSDQEKLLKLFDHMFCIFTKFIYFQIFLNHSVSIIIKLATKIKSRNSFVIFLSDIYDLNCGTFLNL